tara:strand:+ start:11066 stop:11416 length:351 start_codon:yes stop_codon:yes gene_type:complete
MGLTTTVTEKSTTTRPATLAVFLAPHSLALVVSSTNATKGFVVTAFRSVVQMDFGVDAVTKRSLTPNNAQQEPCVLPITLTANVKNTSVTGSIMIVTVSSTKSVHTEPVTQTSIAS